MSQTCPICHGSGGHWAENNETKQRRWVECFRCKGAGQI